MNWIHYAPKDIREQIAVSEKTEGKNANIPVVNVGKIFQFVVNAVKSFKNSMDQYGEARVIVNSSLLNNNIIRKNNQVPNLHLVRQK
jgi:hypothetical protein